MDLIPTLRRFPALLSFSLLFLGSSLSSIEVHVSVEKGDDLAEGSEAAPFRTLEQARDFIRWHFIEAGNEGGARVIIHGGRYPRSETFRLEEQDSGHPEAPVVYQAAPGAEVIFDGGYELHSSLFETVQDDAVLERLLPEVRERVLQADLLGEGITEYGSFGPRGWGRGGLPAPMELILDGVPQRVAQWPNEGTIPLGEVIDSGSKPSEGETDDRPAVFEYNTDRAERWTQAEDLFISGLFGVTWANDTIGIAAIDTEAGTFTTDGAHHYGFAQPGRPGRFETHCRAVNLLEEIEIPGEYYIDRDNGILYFLPPYPLEQSRIQLSSLVSPFISLSEASHIHFEGLTFENARGSGLRMEGGEGNRVMGCTFRTLGAVGVLALGGSNHGVEGCDIYHTGRGGVRLRGGDRRTLRAGSHFVHNTDIHRFNRWIRYYNAAIHASGVEHSLTHNHLHHALHQAIVFSGNEHRFEFNEIHRVLRDISDMGSIYVGRNPTYAGNLIRHNFFHNLTLSHEGGPGVQAIFFDDDTLYVAKVFGNVFYRTGSSGVIKFHGGGGASIANNIAIDSPELVQDSPGDVEGIERAILKMNSERSPDHGFPEMLVEMKVSEDPFRSRYPYLYDTYAEGYNEGTPRWNNFETTVDSGWFVDPDQLDFNLSEGSEPLDYKTEEIHDRVFGLSGEDMAFQPIPFSRIGLALEGPRTDWGPYPFKKLGPVDEAVLDPSGELQLWWQASVNADSYRVRVARDPEFSEMVGQWETTVNHLQVEAPPGGQRYYWQVEAVINKSRSNAGKRMSEGDSWAFEILD